MNVITFFIILAFLGTFAMLVAGGLSMVRGGKFDMQHAEEFMEGRIFMQLVTLGLLIIAVFAWA